MYDRLAARQAYATRPVLPPVAQPAAIIRDKSREAGTPQRPTIGIAAKDQPSFAAILAQLSPRTS